MKKRLLSGLLCAVLLLSLLPAALAATPSRDECAQVLAALDIMVGDKDGNLNLGNSVTRAEFTKLAVAASPSRESVGDTVSIKPYPDVPQNSWAAPWIKAAVDLGLAQGDLRGNFNPDRQISLAEGVTMVLRLLGYQDSDFTGVWPTGQMAQYRALKLDAGVTATQNGPMTRQDAMYLFYNLLVTKTKEGKYYLNTLEPTLNLVSASGEIDRVALVNSAMEGPVVAAKGWEGKVPFDTAGATVYRGGAQSTLSAIQNQDVVYWSKSMRALWAYTNRATGIYEKASPSASAPTAVTVAGKSYPIETTDAAFALSDLGPWKVGDSVTLLLGRGDGVVAVLPPQSASALVYGVVTAVQPTSYDDGKGGTYTASTATVVATDGQSYSYQVADKYLKAGDLVRSAAEGTGVQVRRLSTNSLTGRVNGTATKLGDYTLADDVQILDTYKTATPVRVYPSRIAGVEFKGDMVKFYATNTAGEISHLILGEATGDLFQYGVITDVMEVSANLVNSSSYTYDVAGNKQVFAAANRVYNLKEGPCQVKLTAEGVERLYNLTEVALDSVDGNTALSTGNRKYTVSDGVAVYLVDAAGDYQYSSLSRVTGGGYTLTGWYDKAESEGGRIRVITAKAS